MSDLDYPKRLIIMNHIVPSNICSAFNHTGVTGSKVINHEEFLRILHDAVKNHDFSQDRIPGQGFILIPDAVPFVSSGVGKPTLSVNDYILREYRGKVSAFLKRDHAVQAEGCAAIVYSRKAYSDDPDVTPEEMRRIDSLAEINPLSFPDPPSTIPVTHILVAVLTFAGPQSQLSPYRFTANLAGGNHEAQIWTADEIRAKAKDVVDYDNELVTVAD
jgi:hypothetical protein